MLLDDRQSMTCLEYMLCPENHALRFTRENYAQDFSEEDRDAMSGLPMYEVGLYCGLCDRVYGVSRLREPDKSNDFNSSHSLSQKFELHDKD